MRFVEITYRNKEGFVDTVELTGKYFGTILIDFWSNPPEDLTELLSVTDKGNYEYDHTSDSYIEFPADVY